MALVARFAFSLFVLTALLSGDYTHVSVMGGKGDAKKQRISFTHLPVWSLSNC